MQPRVFAWRTPNHVSESRIAFPALRTQQHWRREAVLAASKTRPNFGRQSTSVLSQRRSKGLSPVTGKNIGAMPKTTGRANQGSLGRGCYPSPRRQPILTEIDAHDGGGGSCLNRPDYDTAAGLQGHPFSATAIRGVYVRLRRTRSHAHVLLLTRSKVPAIAAGPPWLTTAPFQDTVTNKHTLVWRQKKASDGPEAQVRAVTNRGRWVSNPQRP